MIAVNTDKLMRYNIKLWLKDHHYDGAMERIKKLKGKARKDALLMFRDMIIWELMDEVKEKLIDGYEGDYLYDILEFGFKGYDNYTNSELRDEYYEIFGDR